ncbi:FAD-binding oxidoreductase [Phyllobacterium sp. OV277]|uniref:NAD(P)/FAD-dependent oxidoreductase n=1 Tax=Phyllobacterium sp. OV277 TaxID=1882772 RepID=UPI0008919EC4|nr:FAD-binding oxidoreductase [Phyllobacterium sp. OV277]SDP36591.1 D-amino-acid dehydrogenase [Phyllobacterium sp. OV277]
MSQVEKNEEVIVLGAGIVGVSVALHLQQRGRTVMLVDRRGAGEETSYGNAGLIERSSVIPYGVPRDLSTLLRYGLNRSADVHFDWRGLPRIAPWLWRFWRESAPNPLARAAVDMWPLIERSVTEHEILMSQAGVLQQLRKTGWIEAYRDKRTFERARNVAETLHRFGLNYDVLDTKALQQREPHFSNVLTGAIHWLDAATVPDPGGIVKAFATLFINRGGLFLNGDAGDLKQTGSGWSMPTASGKVEAPEVVVALGPWSDTVFRPLGYKIPLLMKRGYHVHFDTKANISLNHPLVDVDGGFLLAPMSQGIRLTTGIEFARRDSLPTPIQLDRTEPFARQILPLGHRIETTPWMGSRPCLPDMRPVIGRGARHKGLWFAFGHNHHGFTLGPVTGRLLAEMITGENTFTDPAPYASTRFTGSL